MDWILWIIGYLAVGFVTCGILWKALGIQWGAEADDTKLLIAITPIGWPLVLLLIVGVWIFKR